MAFLLFLTFLSSTNFISDFSCDVAVVTGINLSIWLFHYCTGVSSYKQLKRNIRFFYASSFYSYRDVFNMFTIYMYNQD